MQLQTGAAQTWSLHRTRDRRAELDPGEHNISRMYWFQSGLGVAVQVRPHAKTYALDNTRRRFHSQRPTRLFKLAATSNARYTRDHHHCDRRQQEMEHEVRVLPRTPRRTDSGFNYEPDQRHAEIIIKEFDLCSSSISMSDSSRHSPTGDDTHVVAGIFGSSRKQCRHPLPRELVPSLNLRTSVFAVSNGFFCDIHHRAIHLPARAKHSRSV